MEALENNNVNVQISEAILNGLYEISPSEMIAELQKKYSFDIKLIGNRMKVRQDVAPTFIKQAAGLYSHHYGCLSARGIIIRSGRASFDYLLNHLDTLDALTSSTYRLLPRPRRIKEGLEYLALLYSGWMNIQIMVSENGFMWVWSFQPGGTAADNECQPVIYYLLGLVQEFIYWAGGGRIYPITFREDPGQGLAGTLFEICKKPLD